MFTRSPSGMPRKVQGIAPDFPIAIDARTSQPSRGMRRAESSAMGAPDSGAETANGLLRYL